MQKVILISKYTLYAESNTDTLARSCNDIFQYGHRFFKRKIIKHMVTSNLLLIAIANHILGKKDLYKEATTILRLPPIMLWLIIKLLGLSQTLVWLFFLANVMG